MNKLDNSIYKTLGEAGLSQSESEVYVSGLVTGQLKSSELISKTGMPRPTVMAALKVLTDLRLCETHRIDGRSFGYTMLPASNLKAVLGQKIRQLDDVIGRLDDLKLPSQTGQTVRRANSLKSVQDLLELALRCKSRHWQIIAPYDNALRQMPVEYISYFKRIRADRQIESQTLWEFGSNSMQVSLHDVLMRKPRFVPSDINPVIPSLILCFDDTLLTIDLDKSGKMSAVLIENPGTAATFRIVFEMAWRSAR